MTIAVVQDINLSEDMILGHLEFHSIPELKVPKEEFGLLWQKHGLDQKYLPDKIRPSDAFKRATREAAMSLEIDYNGKKMPAKTLVRNILMDDHQILRHLIREVILPDTEEAKYEAVGFMRFNRKNNLMEIGNFGFEYEYPYQDILNDSQSLFNEYVQYHTKDTIRNLVVRLINDSNPTPIMPKSQGKFIPKAYATRLGNIQALLDETRDNYAKGSDMHMDLIPIVNTEQQRELFGRKANFAMQDLADDLINQFAEYMQKKPEIKLEVAERMVRDAQDLIRRTNEYEQLMGVRMELIQQQLQDFMNNVKLKAEQ